MLSGSSCPVLLTSEPGKSDSGYVTLTAGMLAVPFRGLTGVWCRRVLHCKFSQLLHDIMCTFFEKATKKAGTSYQEMKLAFNLN